MRYVLLAILGLGLGGLTAVQAFEEEKKPAEKKGEETTIEAKQDKSVAGTTVNFSDKLELPFPGLTTLGARIEQARTAADPVALAQLAAELDVAEKVSGKKAPIARAELTAEAVALADLRSRPIELKAVVLTVGDADLKAKLEKALARATTKEAEGEKTRGIRGELVVAQSLRPVRPGLRERLPGRPGRCPQPCLHPGQRAWPRAPVRPGRRSPLAQPRGRALRSVSLESELIRPRSGPVELGPPRSV